jgi:multidrug efflux pump
MTSFAFIFGVIPLMVASGAGAEMRRSLGIAVFSGMLGVTVFGIFLTPVFFYLLMGLGQAKLITSVRGRWVASAVIGGVLGLVVGYLMWGLGVVRLPWALAVGAATGVTAVVAVLGLHERIRPKAQK